MDTSISEPLDKYGYPMNDELTSVFRDRLNHSTGKYIKDNNMWSLSEYDEWQSYQFDRGKEELEFIN